MKIISILSISLILISCAKDHEIKKECDKTTITGEWVWIKTTGGVSDAYITPSNSGFSKKLEIDDFVWKEYINDSIVFEAAYTLNVNPDSSVYHGRVNWDNQVGLSFEIRGCSLTLMCGFEDCFTDFYEREF